MLTSSRGMGASAMLGVALVASYGALAAVALHGLGVGGGLLGLPGRALDAVVKVDAAHLTSPSPGHSETPHLRQPVAALVAVAVVAADHPRS